MVTVEDGAQIISGGRWNGDYWSSKKLHQLISTLEGSMALCPVGTRLANANEKYLSYE